MLAKLLYDLQQQWVGILALVISVASFYVSYRSYKRDNPDVRVELEYRPETGRGTAFLVLLRNCGRRRVEIKSLSLCLKSGKSLPYKQLPLDLEPEASRECWFHLWDYKDDLDEAVEFSQLDRVEARDIRDRRYRFPSNRCAEKRAYRQIRKQLAEHWRPGNPNNSWMNDTQ